MVRQRLETKCGCVQSLPRGLKCTSRPYGELWPPPIGGRGCPLGDATVGGAVEGEFGRGTRFWWGGRSTTSQPSVGVLSSSYLHPPSWGWAQGGCGSGRACRGPGRQGGCWQGRPGRDRPGRGSPAPPQCCIWEGDLSKMRQTRKEKKREKKEKKGKKMEEVGRKKQFVGHTLDRGSWLAGV